ncbi:MAG TPA: LppX_LprAFG lipoprotein [Ktedonobacteraceae bacterium]|nr:LppX_LprAFG lipoprotein [Ktedonobacteraceae bacterium]
MFSFRCLLKRVLALVALVAASALLIVGCTAPWQHSANAVGLTAKPTAQQLITAVEKSYKTVSSFHVVLQVNNTGPADSSQVQIRSANGDIILPDKVKAQATIVLSGQAVSVELISIGDTQYITDPITGQWRVIKGLIDPRTLTNPNTGIISLLNKVQKVSQPTDDTVGGVPCWRISGLLDAKYLSFFTGGGAPAGTMLQTSACVGKLDGLLYQVKVTGQAAPNDTPDTTYLFNISNYNEHITITAPQV